MTIRSWIKNREMIGHPTFSTNDVREAFPDTSSRLVSIELNRLAKQKIILLVYKSFYTVIPVQYAVRGIVPPLFYIDQLMSYLKKPYYISLLSAAELHGAAHQRPQKFSVTTVLPKPTTSTRLNNIVIWNYRREIPQNLLWQKNSETGRVKYSSPELTAADLVQYERHIGGLSVVATILEELLEYTDFTRNFSDLTIVTSIPTLQRLGYIVEEILEGREQADVLYNLLRTNSKRLKKTPLALGLSFDGCPCNNRWNIIINQSIEPDEL
jgi:predicted transcriptional regulator of viral defense system